MKEEEMEDGWLSTENPNAGKEGEKKPEAQDIDD